MQGVLQPALGEVFHGRQAQDPAEAAQAGVPADAGRLGHLVQGELFPKVGLEEGDHLLGPDLVRALGGGEVVAGKLLSVLGDGLPHLAHQAVDVQLIGPRLRLAQGVGLAEQVQHLPLPGDLRGEAQAAEPLAAQEGGHVFLVNDALRRRQEGGVHDDREHLRVRGVGGGLGHVEDVGVFEDALAGGEGVVLVFHVVLHGAPGDDVELQLRMPVPVDAGPVKLVHDVQVKPNGVFRRPPELQGHQGVVRQDFRDLHSGLLCEKVPEYCEIIRCDFSKWML